MRFVIKGLVLPWQNPSPGDAEDGQKGSTPDGFEQSLLHKACSVFHSLAWCFSVYFFVSCMLSSWNNFGCETLIPFGALESILGEVLALHTSLITELA